MNIYSLHYIYRAIFIIALMLGTSSCVSMILDPVHLHSAYKVLMLTVKCSVCAYAWYVLFTTVYRIEVSDGNINLKSLIKKTQIRDSEIRDVRSDQLFLRVIHDRGRLTIPYQMDGVANVKSIFTVSSTGTPTRSLSEESATESKWPKLRLTVLIIFIISFPLFYFWSFLNQMEGGVLYKLADVLQRSHTEILLQTRFSPLAYILLVFILFLSTIDTLLLIALKGMHIDATNTYLRQYSGGVFWNDVGIRIGLVWGIVLLDRAFSSLILSALPLAAILGVSFLLSTIRIAIRQKSCN